MKRAEFLFLLSLFFNNVKAQPPPDYLSPDYRFVCTIFSLDKSQLINEKSYVGSCFYIKWRNRHLILTAAHVLRNRDYYLVYFNTTGGIGVNRPVAPFLVGLNEARDVAVLEVLSSDTLFLPNPGLVGNSDSLRLGASVSVVFGMYQPGNMQFWLEKGWVVNNRMMVPGQVQVRFIVTSASVLPGASGAPLLAGSGEIVGMVTGTMAIGERQENTHRSTAIPINDIVESLPYLLTDNPGEYRPFRQGGLPELTAGLCIYWEPLCITGAVYLVKVPGWLEKAGLRVGDVVLEVDGVPVKDFVHFRELITNKHQVGETVTITVGRKTNTGYVILSIPVVLREIK
jgi:S1-C subfamily serine protease